MHPLNTQIPNWNEVLLKKRLRILIVFPTFFVRRPEAELFEGSIYLLADQLEE